MANQVMHPFALLCHFEFADNAQLCTDIFMFNQTPTSFTLQNELS